MTHPRTRRPWVLVAVILSMFVGSIEATIVATSMPTIVARLGDMSLYSWVFSSYLLMQVVAGPVLGKLSDIFGRRRLLAFGLAIFVAGSLLCGMAWSMQSLVAFRLLQGLGGGAVLPLALTLVADLYPVEQRGRIQGYLASVWGVSAIVGPLAGALIVQHWDWAWVFWVNVPTAVLACVLVLTCLHEELPQREMKVDYLGAALLAVLLATLMLAVTHAAELSGATLFGLIAVGLLSAVLFVRQERRAADPMVDFRLWKNPLIAVANATNLLSGMVISGVIAFLPTFAQGVLGSSAMRAGFTLSAMSIGWPIASVLAGRWFTRLGARRLARQGGLALLVGSLLLALAVQTGAGVTLATVSTLFIGLGMGTISITFLMSIQATVPWAQRGAATSANMLMRMLGNAMGTALCGGLLNLLVQRHLGAAGWGGQLGVEDMRRLLGGAVSQSDPALLAALREALAAGLHWVFWGVFVAGVLTLLLAWQARDLAPAQEPAGGTAEAPSGESTQRLHPQPGAAK